MIAIAWTGWFCMLPWVAVSLTMIILGIICATDYKEPDDKIVAGKTTVKEVRSLGKLGACLGFIMIIALAVVFLVSK